MIECDRRQAARDVATEVRGCETPDASRGRVLVVDDNEVNRRVAARLVERMGYAVDVAADGSEALDALDRCRYGLVLMDCQMPVMDGYEATQRIREREDAQTRVPIVALTAHAVEANRTRCLEIGMDDFLTKPVSLDELRRVLESWIAPPAGSA